MYNIKIIMISLIYIAPFQSSRALYNKHQKCEENIKDSNERKKHHVIYNKTK